MNAWGGSTICMPGIPQVGGVMTIDMGSIVAIDMGSIVATEMAIDIQLS